MDVAGLRLRLQPAYHVGDLVAGVGTSASAHTGCWPCRRARASATRASVHFADYEDLPSKKIWSWGVDDEGKDWRKALSDDDSAYIEIQAGLFRNQETYAFLKPRQSIHFSEYWMPTREIGATSRANLSGVLSFGRHGNTLNVGFNANRELPKATVSILSGNRSLFREKVDLTPDRAWMHDLLLATPRPHTRLKSETQRERR